MRVLLPILVLSTLVDITVNYLSLALVIVGVILVGFCLNRSYSRETIQAPSSKNTYNLSHGRASSIVKADRRADLSSNKLGKDSLTVLVVDDDLMVANTCCSMLRAIGIQCISAKDGREAIDLSATHSAAIDLVILDLMMPGLPSNRVVNELWSRDPALPVVIATGWDRSRIHPEILRAPNVRRILYKPYDLQALRAACEFSRVRSGRKIA